MEVKEYFNIAEKFCRKHDCWTCPINRFSCALPNIDTIDIVIKWAKKREVEEVSK